MFTIYSKEACPYCKEAEKALTQCGLEYEKHDIEKNSEARNFFFVYGGFKTVPQVFYGDLYIGGYEELADYLLEHFC